MSTNIEQSKVESKVRQRGRRQKYKTNEERIEARRKQQKEYRERKKKELKELKEFKKQNEQNNNPP